MDKQDSLPKPQTDLPLPETQIPAASPSGTTSSFKSNNSFPKGILIAILLLVLIGSVTGAYLMGKSSVNPQLTQTTPTQTSTAVKQVPTATSIPTPDSTANWQSYNSDCGFSIKYPASIIDAKKYLLTIVPPNPNNPIEDCAEIFSRDVVVGIESIEGFDILIARVKLGTKFDNTTINSLDDYIAYFNSGIDVNFNFKHKTIGSQSGIEYELPGVGERTGFFFEHGGYVYETIWDTKYSEPHRETIDKILGSISFTQ